MFWEINKLLGNSLSLWDLPWTFIRYVREALFGAKFFLLFFSSKRPYYVLESMFFESQSVFTPDDCGAGRGGIHSFWCFFAQSKMDPFYACSDQYSAEDLQESHCWSLEFSWRVTFFHHSFLQNVAALASLNS